MYTGKCLCGSVEYQIHGEIEDIVICHCSQCRKAQGSAFATNGNVKKENFKFISGEDNLTKFASNETKHKFFCKTCGSPVLATDENNPDAIRIRLGSIEGNINEKISRHIFVGSKANWDILPHDNLTQHKEW